MSTRRMPADEYPIGIAIEGRRVGMNPRDRATDLVGDDPQIMRILDGDEIEHDIVGAGIDEQLGGERVVPGAATEPSAAVNEYEDWGVRPLCGVEVERFDRCWAIGQASREADARPHG